MRRYRAKRGRSASGVALPLIAVGLIAFVALLAIATDINRMFYVKRKLTFAADMAAPYVLQRSLDAKGAISSAKLTKAIKNFNDLKLNKTLGKLDSEKPEGPIHIVPDSSTDGRLQVSAEMAGNNPLELTFLPVISNYFRGARGTPNEIEFTSKSTAVLQPATRVGFGLASTQGVSPQDVALSASFPLAVSESDFQQFASATGGNYSIVLRPPSQPTTSSRIPLRGDFVNLVLLRQAYGAAHSATDLTKLRKQIGYFVDESPMNSPACLERGSVLEAFDARDILFKQQEGELIQLLNRAANGRTFLLPVTRANGRQRTVAGFACVSLRKVVALPDGGLSVEIQAVKSTAVPNAASGGGLRSTPPFELVSIPRALEPFQDRNADGSMQGPYRGVAMAVECATAGEDVP